MANIAVCIGINDYPGTGLDLQGCVADAHAWANVFSRVCPKPPQLILDGQATKANIMRTVGDALASLKAGDWAFVTFSGHGTWVPDDDGDEPDGRDECLVPHDYNRGLIRDDEIHQLLMTRPAGSHVFLVSDACNSGTAFRMFRPMPYDPLATTELATEPKSRIRFMPPDMLIHDYLGRRNAELVAARARLPKPKPLPGVIHFAGCADVEYCYDAWFNGQPNGAFTWCALHALSRMRRGSQFDTWHRHIRTYLPSYSYPQTPQLNAHQIDQRTEIPFLV